VSSHAERLGEIDRGFAELLEAEPVLRAARLAEIGRDDPELADEVAELLRRAEADEGRETDAGWMAGPLWRELDARWAGEEPAAGERLGAYRLVREIGRGGMAVVYLAERADGAFEQTVAVKLLRPGGGGLEAIRRFEQERQILAGLKHPAIARLLDGGIDARGRPFLVLEYVEGEPIDRFCDRHGLPLERRLELFEQAARAVESAHHSLVVHRDIKPSNILVEEGGTVKLLDFGIARLLDPDGAGAAGSGAPATRTLLRAMTPEYASPEQVSGEPMTTASDVYQLGLLLYELLTGERAYRVPTGSPAAVEQAICGQIPRRPSTVAGARPPGNAALSRRLAGDLDNILLTALAKEPERRYPTVRELLDDLERHREGRPVRARPATLSYRMGKFARRHRWGLAAALLLGALLVSYAATVTLQAAQIARERDRARAEASKALQVKGLLAGLFEGADPEQARGREITAREALAHAGERIERQLGGQPEVQAELLATVGEIYRKLGLFAEAAPLLERAAAISRTLGTEAKPVRVAALTRLARLHLDQGDAAAAERLLREALALSAGAESLEAAAALSDLAVALQQQGRLAEATGLFRRALASRERLLGPASLAVAESSSLLAGNLRREGDLPAAEALHRRSLALRRRLLPPDHPDLASTLNDLALTHVDQGRYAEAEPLLRESLAVQEKVFGLSHPRIATALGNLAMAVRRLGDPASAEPMVRRALAIQQAQLPARHPAIAATLNTLGRVLQDEGKLAAAGSYYADALAIFAEDHPFRARVQFNLGTLREAEGRFAQAESIYREVLATQRRQLGDDHPAIGLDLLQLGSVRFAQGDRAGAEPLWRQALARFRRKLPAGHPDMAQALVSLGGLLAGDGRAAEAEPLLAEALAIRQARYGEASPRTIEARLALRHCREAMGGGNAAALLAGAKPDEKGGRSAERGGRELPTPPAAAGSSGPRRSGSR
jgi:serine/threonine protein kinase/tetratricopeptide (TPR) repeat protein